MAKCLYPNCEAEAIYSNGWGYCGICGGSMQACGQCSAFNRNLARYCRTCGAPFEYKELLPGAYSSAIAKWSTPDKRLATQERFWGAPIAYGGWLWMLSAEGQLSRYSPFSGSLTPVVHLGEEYGRTAPIARVEMPAGDRWTQPGIVALSRSGILAIGLIDGRETKVGLQAGETAVADFTKEPCGLDSCNQEVYLLTRRSHATCLAVISLLTGKVESRFDIPDERVAGPLCCAGHTYVYSQTQLHDIFGGRLRSFNFPAGFAPSLEARDQSLRQAFGRLPFMVGGSCLYIPGRQGDNSAFLMLNCATSIVGRAMIPVIGETTYTQDTTGRPVLAHEGSIAVLDEAVRRVIRVDEQLSAQCPALVLDDIALGMARPSPTSLRLRIFHGERVADFTVSRESFLESSGIYALGNSLTFCSTLKDTTLGIYSWIC